MSGDPLELQKPGLSDEVIPPRRHRARRGEGEQLREDILEAAERLLIKTGNKDAVSIRAVAKTVGVTPPSIYLHFTDKNELLFQVCQVHWGRFDAHLRNATEGIDDPVERIAACGRAYIEFGLANPEHYRILFMSKPDEQPSHTDVDELLCLFGFTRLIQAVSEAVERGQLVGDPALIVFHAWSLVHGLTSLLISHPDMPWPDRETLTKHLLETSMRGLAPDRISHEA